MGWQSTTEVVAKDCEEVERHLLSFLRKGIFVVVEGQFHPISDVRLYVVLVLKAFNHLCELCHRIESMSTYLLVVYALERIQLLRNTGT